MTRSMCLLLAFLLLTAPCSADPDATRDELRQRLAELRAAQQQVQRELDALEEPKADEPPAPRRRQAWEPHQADRAAGPAPRRRPAWEPRKTDHAQGTADPLELLREIDPDMHARLERLRETNPERAERMLDAARRRLAGLAELKETDPEAFALRVENMQAMRRAGRLAARVAELEDAGDTDGAQHAKAELRAEAEAMFDRLLSHQREQTQHIEQRLSQAKQSIAEMQEHRDERITERVDEAIERARARLRHSDARPGAEPRDLP